MYAFARTFVRDSLLLDGRVPSINTSPAVASDHRADMIYIISALFFLGVIHFVYEMLVAPSLSRWRRS